MNRKNAKFRDHSQSKYSLKMWRKFFRIACSCFMQTSCVDIQQDVKVPLTT